MLWICSALLRAGLHRLHDHHCERYGRRLFQTQKVCELGAKWQLGIFQGWHRRCWQGRLNNNT